MSNEQKRAEITDLLYALINREIEKKEKDINITLIDECYELLRSLKSVKEFSSEEIDIRTEAILSKTNIRTHKNKKIKIRLIAAIIAILLLMGIATYTFYDELAYEIEQVYRSAKPGVLYRNEKFDLEISENYIIFSSIEELTEYLDTPIWIPTNIPKGYDLTYIDVAEYSEYKKAILIWSNEINRITYSVNFGLSNINTEEYNSINRNFVSKKGHEYIIVNVQNDLQAITIINNNYYSIKAPNKRILEKILNSMKFVN